MKLLEIVKRPPLQEDIRTTSGSTVGKGSPTGPVWSSRSLSTCPKSALTAMVCLCQPALPLGPYPPLPAPTSPYQPLPHTPANPSSSDQGIADPCHLSVLHGVDGVTWPAPEGPGIMPGKYEISPGVRGASPGDQGGRGRFLEEGGVWRRGR